MAILTIVREDGPPVLVTVGVPEEVEREMKGTHYCSTAVLCAGEEFVVLNPHEDWRCVVSSLGGWGTELSVGADLRTTS